MKRPVQVFGLGRNALPWVPTFLSRLRPTVQAQLKTIQHTQRCIYQIFHCVHFNQSGWKRQGVSFGKEQLPLFNATVRLTAIAWMRNVAKWGSGTLR